MHVPNNEGKVCDAVVRFIEKRTGEIRTQVRRPELNGVGPQVDLRVKFSAQKYAIEHTRVESFENQIRTGSIVEEIIGHIKKKNIVPFPSTAYYELHYPIDVSLPDRKVKRDCALNNLVEWICTSEKILRRVKSDQPLHSYPSWVAYDFVRGKPEGFDCTFDLLRWLDAIPIRRKPGALWTKPINPEDLEPLSRKRLNQAFHKKCPKLQRCKTEGVRTVLVLESSDVDLRHYEFRGSLLPDLLAKHKNAPDEIYLVETHLNPWWVWPIKCDDGNWPTKGLPEMGQPIYEEDKLPTAGMPKRYRDALGMDELFKPHPKGWVPEIFWENELKNLSGP